MGDANWIKMSQDELATVMACNNIGETRCDHHRSPLVWAFSESMV